MQFQPASLNFRQRLSPRRKIEALELAKTHCAGMGVASGSLWKVRRKGTTEDGKPQAGLAAGETANFQLKSL